MMLTFPLTPAVAGPRTGPAAPENGGDPFAAVLTRAIAEGDPEPAVADVPDAPASEDSALTGGLPGDGAETAPSVPVETTTWPGPVLPGAAPGHVSSNESAERAPAEHVLPDRAEGEPGDDLAPAQPGRTAEEQRGRSGSGDVRPAEAVGPDAGDAPVPSADGSASPHGRTLAETAPGEARSTIAPAPGEADTARPAPAPAVPPSGETGADAAVRSDRPVNAPAPPIAPAGTGGHSAMTAPEQAPPSARESAAHVPAPAAASVVETIPASLSVSPAGPAIPASAPASPAPVVVHVPQEEAAQPLPQQISTALAHLRSAPSGEHVLVLRVHPEELGPVRVTAYLGADGVRVELAGATDQAREALRGSLGELRRELAATGLQADLSLTTSGRGDPGAGSPGRGLASGDGSGNPHDPRGPRAGSGEPQVRTSPAPRPSPASDNQLDLLI